MSLTPAMQKLVPKNPENFMMIKRITDRIITLSVPFWRVGRIAIGGRATMVKLTSGNIAVFSPVALTQEVKDLIRDWLREDPNATVKYLIALDYEHHIFLGQWFQEFPAARVIGPEGLPEKRAANKTENVPFHTVFTAANKERITIDPPGEQDFDLDFLYEYVDVHRNKELVFFFQPEKTLIEADLLFNLPAVEQNSRIPLYRPNVWTKVMNWLFSTKGAAQRRIVWLGSRKNRPRFDASIRRINSWDFVRLIPCHGEVLETDGKEVFERVMEWHLKPKSV